MKLICPVCQSKFTLAQVAHEAQMREVADLAAKFGRSWELVHEYVDCFRSSQWGSVGLKKTVRILKEVWALFEMNEFKYDGRRYRTDWARINAALRSVANAEKYGFMNHNYLKKVLMGEAERVSAEGMTAKEEREREQKRINRRPTQTDADGEMTSTYAEWLEKQKPAK